MKSHLTVSSFSQLFYSIHAGGDQSDIALLYDKAISGELLAPTYHWNYNTGSAASSAMTLTMWRIFIFLAGLIPHLLPCGTSLRQR